MACERYVLDLSALDEKIENRFDSAQLCVAELVGLAQLYVAEPVGRVDGFVRE